MVSRQEIWQSPPSDLRLGKDEVHVWRASLEQDASEVRLLRAILSLDEQQRADRFHFERDRHHFIVAHSMLRDILSRYLRRPPAQVHFSYNEFGKPALARDDTGIRFNLSHSHGLGLCALTHACEIGVDIEYLRDDFASFEIAERFFSPIEVEVLRSLPEHLRVQAFFNCWTRKEAYIKALGEGLSHPLHLFAVTLTPGDPARLLHTNNDPEATQWSLAELTPREGYVAAVAVRGSMPELHCWQWQG
jgi:4'-phosphopantetheinyl transferase